MDPIADMLVTIKNGYMARKTHVDVRMSKFKYELAKLLEKEKFVSKTEKKDNLINIKLSYIDDKPKITEIKRVSKVSVRTYSKSKHLKSVRGGRGLLIISTSHGVMSEKDAKSKNLGGEVICRIW